jgi:hypothetical protein
MDFGPGHCSANEAAGHLLISSSAREAIRLFPAQALQRLSHSDHFPHDVLPFAEFFREIWLPQCH